MLEVVTYRLVYGGGRSGEQPSEMHHQIGDCMSHCAQNRSAVQPQAGAAACAHSRTHSQPHEAALPFLVKDSLECTFLPSICKGPLSSYLKASRAHQQVHQTTVLLHVHAASTAHAPADGRSYIPASEPVHREDRDSVLAGPSPVVACMSASSKACSKCRPSSSKAGTSASHCARSSSICARPRHVSFARSFPRPRAGRRQGAGQRPCDCLRLLPQLLHGCALYELARKQVDCWQTAGESLAWRICMLQSDADASLRSVLCIDGSSLDADGGEGRRAKLPVEQLQGAIAVTPRQRPLSTRLCMRTPEPRYKHPCFTELTCPRKQKSHFACMQPGRAG